MTTTLRNCSFIDPNADPVRIGQLAATMGMTGRVSPRELVDRRDRVRVSGWGVCIATFGGAPRATAYDNAFVDRVFGDVDGVARDDPACQRRPTVCGVGDVRAA